MDAMFYEKYYFNSNDFLSSGYGLVPGLLLPDLPLPPDPGDEVHGSPPAPASPRRPPGVRPPQPPGLSHLQILRDPEVRAGHQPFQPRAGRAGDQPGPGGTETDPLQLVEPGPS